MLFPFKYLVKMEIFIKEVEKPAIQNEHGAPFQPTKLCNDIFLGYERHELTMYEKLLFTMGSMFRLYGISA